MGMGLMNQPLTSHCEHQAMDYSIGAASLTSGKCRVRFVVSRSTILVVVFAMISLSG